jgi:hypothetical protein
MPVLKVASGRQAAAVGAAGALEHRSDVGGAPGHRIVADARAAGIGVVGEHARIIGRTGTFPGAQLAPGNIHPWCVGSHGLTPDGSGVSAIQRLLRFALGLNASLGGFRVLLELLRILEL